MPGSGHTGDDAALEAGGKSATPAGEKPDAVGASAGAPVGEDDLLMLDGETEEWDDEDEFGWAVGSELEFLEDGFEEWDGPVGDGLDEEEGLGGLAIRGTEPEKGDSSPPQAPADDPSKR